MVIKPIGLLIPEDQRGEFVDLCVKKLTCREVDSYNSAANLENVGPYYKMIRMARILACNMGGELWWPGDDAHEKMYDLPRELIDVIVNEGQELNGIGDADVLETAAKN